MAISTDQIRIPAIAPDPAEAAKLAADVAPGQAPIVPLRLEGTASAEGYAQIDYALFVVNQDQLQITQLTAILLDENQQPVTYQVNRVGQLGNRGSTGGWGGQWVLGGLQPYAGQTLTIAVGGQYSIAGADEQNFGPFEATFPVPKS